MVSHKELLETLDLYDEWLLENSAGRGFALRRSEIELQLERGRILLGFIDDRGWQVWRVRDFERRPRGALRFDLVRNFERDHERIRLVPRTLAAEFGASVELARIETAERLARAFLEARPKLRLLRVTLNKENGRLAQIVVQEPDGAQFAVISDVTGLMTAEALMSTAVQTLLKLERRRRNMIDSVRIAARSPLAGQLRRLQSLLRPEWRKRTGVVEIAGDDVLKLTDREPYALSALWRHKPGEVRPTALPEPSETARGIVALAPDEIDVVFAKHGETLRWLGLPFARVRRAMGVEKLWFGAENPRRLLTRENGHEFDELIASLGEYRRGDSPSRQHFLYRASPEAWLESMLRRNVGMLDANLVLSPVHHQFRTGRERVDLLALRRDGRLVIIELKTDTDRDVVYQVADYWRRVEVLRRSGKLAESRLFGELEIADAPAICYVLAPTLSFHRDVEAFMRTLTPEIAIHRFNLSENWRVRFKVFERR